MCIDTRYSIYGMCLSSHALLLIINLHGYCVVVYIRPCNAVMCNKQDLDMHKISPQHITMYNLIQVAQLSTALHHVLSCTRSSAGHINTSVQ